MRAMLSMETLVSVRFTVPMEVRWNSERPARSAWAHSKAYSKVQPSRSEAISKCARCAAAAQPGRGLGQTSAPPSAWPRAHVIHRTVPQACFAGALYPLCRPRRDGGRQGERVCLARARPRARRREWRSGDRAPCSRSRRPRDHRFVGRAFRATAERDAPRRFGSRPWRGRPPVAWRPNWGNGGQAGRGWSLRGRVQSVCRGNGLRQRAARLRRGCGCAAPTSAATCRIKHAPITVAARDQQASGRIPIVKLVSYAFHKRTDDSS